ncbi:hypothetical protein T5B8_04808 [Salinisphaera sp. T5B8]
MHIDRHRRLLLLSLLLTPTAIAFATATGSKHNGKYNQTGNTQADRDAARVRRKRVVHRTIPEGVGITR